MRFGWTLLTFGFVVGCVAGSDDDGLTIEDLSAVCDDARECVSTDCAQEASALAEHNASDPPAYDQTCEEFCAAECMAGNVGCDGGAQIECNNDCLEMRKAEDDAWTDMHDSLIEALAACTEQRCTAPHTFAQVHSSNCDGDYDDDDARRCAIGVGAFTAQNCAEQAECLFAGNGVCF